MRKYLSTLLLLIPFLLHAQIPPANYYNAANGKAGYDLKTALYQIIKGHHVLSYGDLYNAYETTDTKANQVVWDMYSDVPGGTAAYYYTHHNNNCGNYSSEGDCYNREHSFPQSWFSEGSPMKTDLFHVVPSDGKVNGMRSSYPFGEVASITWTSTNGSKVGSSSSPGYSGTVFEPIDEYKGDFARSYFYMATRYENLIGGWKNNGSADAVLDGSNTKVYDDWCVNLLLKWHEQDPVSQKEIDRNNAIYTYQQNRNPFIDHPTYANIIWNGAPADTVPEDSTGHVIIEPSSCIDFSNLPAASSSYSSRTWKDANGIQWNASLARTDQEINGESICLDDSSFGSLTSANISGGISGISFKTQQKFSGSGGQLSLYINNVLAKTVDVSSSVSNHQISGLNVSGNFTLKFLTNGATRIAIDDICIEQITSTKLTKQSAENLEVFPNPCSDKLFIQMNGGENFNVEMYAVNGKQLYRRDNNIDKLEINTQALRPGIYLIVISTESGHFTTRKIVRF